MPGSGTSEGTSSYRTVAAHCSLGTHPAHVPVSFGPRDFVFWFLDLAYLEKAANLATLVPSPTGHRHLEQQQPVPFAGAHDLQVPAALTAPYCLFAHFAHFLSS